MHPTAGAGVVESACGDHARFRRPRLNVSARCQSGVPHSQPLLFTHSLPRRAITTLRNGVGVDLDLFRHVDRDTARRPWTVDGRQRFHRLDDQVVAFAFDEPWPGSPEGCVCWARWPTKTYRRCTVLPMLSSWPRAEKGWANVLLDAMACGTPVVPMDVWGTAEVVKAPAVGWRSHQGAIGNGDRRGSSHVVRQPARTCRHPRVC
jgi:Glycosyl transferases group 1